MSRKVLLDEAGNAAKDALGRIIRTEPRNCGPGCPHCHGRGKCTAGMVLAGEEATAPPQKPKRRIFRGRHA